MNLNWVRNAAQGGLVRLDDPPCLVGLLVEDFDGELGEERFDPGVVHHGHCDAKDIAD